MATTTSSALAKLRRRRQSSNEAYRKTVSASLNKYGKVVQQSFQEGLVSRAALVAKREERENVQNSLRERFTAATSNVLSRDTLAMLHEHSTIAAPTLTSIFTGYETARADRADRFEKLLDKREDGMKRIEAADELAFRDAAANRQQSLAAQSNILNSGLAAQKALFASDGQGMATEAQFANTEIEISARQEEARRAREQALSLQKHRDKIAASRDAANNAQALARLDKQIGAATTRATIASEKAVALAKQKATADQVRFEASKTFALKQQGQQQTFTAGQNAANRTAAATRQTSQQTFTAGQNAANRTAAATRQTNAQTYETEQQRKLREYQEEVAKQEVIDEKALIAARTAGQIELKGTAGAGTAKPVKPFNSSTLGMLTSGAFTAPTPDAAEPKVYAPPYGETPKPPEVDNPVIEGGTVAAEPVTVKELGADGVARDVVVENFGAVVPNAGTEPTGDQGEAPGVPDGASAADYYSENLAQSDDPIGEATQLLSSVLAERNPDLVANLGDSVTFDQLADLINEDEEEDTRITSVLSGIRNYRTTEIS